MLSLGVQDWSMSPMLRENERRNHGINLAVTVLATVVITNKTFHGFFWDLDCNLCAIWNLDLCVLLATGVRNVEKCQTEPILLLNALVRDV